MRPNYPIRMVATDLERSRILIPGRFVHLEDHYKDVVSPDCIIWTAMYSLICMVLCEVFSDCQISNPYENSVCLGLWVVQFLKQHHPAVHIHIHKREAANQHVFS